MPADEEALLTLRKVRDATVRRLGALQEQQARYGALTPPNVTLDIEDAKREIERIDQRLLVLEQPPPSPEVRQAIYDTHGSMIDFIAAQGMYFGQRLVDLELKVSSVIRTQTEEREERPERQRILDQRLDKQDRFLRGIIVTLSILALVVIALVFRVWELWAAMFR